MKTGPTHSRIEIPISSGWAGWFAFAVVVAARAFQPNAQPMRDWSWWSWLLMSMPALWPLWASAALGILWLVSASAAAALGSVASFFRRR